MMNRMNRHLAWQNVTMLFFYLSVWWYRLFCWHSWCWYFTLVGFFPESVWTKGSSKSGGLLYIFTCSHLHHIFSSSHLHIFSSSHLHILSSSHLHIFSSPRLHILTSSQLHTFTSSHLHIFTSSHLHVFTSSHLLSFTSSHLLIFTSSHLHILTFAHLHIFTYSHPHICTSSHIFSLSLSFFSLAPCHGLSPSFSFHSQGRRQCPRGATIWPLFRTKWGSSVKNWWFFASFVGPVKGFACTGACV